MALVWTKTANPAVQLTGGSGSASFNGVSIGTAADDRIVVVSVANDYQLTGVTIGGSAATQVVISNTGSNNQASLWSRLVTTGTTTDVVVSSAYFEHVGITVGILTGANETATDTAAANYTGATPSPFTCGPITVPSGGIALLSFGAMGMVEVTPTWNSGTQDYSTYNTDLQIVSGYHPTSGDQTFSLSSATWDYGQIKMAAAAWEPSGGGGPTPGSIVFTITL